MLFAPRLSTTIGWPSRPDIFCAHSRHHIGVPPPVYGTIQRIGLVG